MLDDDAFERITEAINDFAEGNPVHFETVVSEGVYFDFDCPFDHDLMEPKITVTVGFKEWSPHKDDEPEGRLMDYGDGFGDELTCRLDEAFHNAGSRNEEVVMEYSKHNSGNGLHLFLGSIHNPRVAFDPDAGETVVVEEYA